MLPDYQYLLVVDDQAGIRQLLSEFFTGEGYRVELAVNGLETLAKVRAKKPALILLDLKMPQMGGMETLYQLKSIAPGVPIILITAYIESLAFDITLEHHVLVKPFDLGYALYLVKRILKTPPQLARRYVI